MKKSLHKILMLSSVILFLLSLLSCDIQTEVPTNLVTTPYITGNIFIPTEFDLSNDSIWVKESSTNKIAKVNTDGSFILDGLIEGEDYTLYFSDTPPSTISKSLKTIDLDEYHLGAQAPDAIASKENNVPIGTIPLTVNGSITGKATLLDGNEDTLDNVGIDVYIPGTSFMAKTDEEGNYTLTNVPQGTYKLRYEKDTYQGIYSEEIILKQDEFSKDVPILETEDAILIKATGIVSGTVIIKDAIDNAGILILLENDDKSLSFTGSSSSDGSFLINNIVPDSYNLTISKEHCITKIINNTIVNGGETSTIDGPVYLIKQVGNITGIVKTKDGEPCQGVQVVAIDSEGEKFISHTTTDGSYDVKDLLPDTYLLQFVKAGYFEETIDDIIIKSGLTSTMDTTVLLIKSAAITGNVFLSGATSYSGVQVVATPNNTDIETYQTLSLDDGSYTILDVLEGQFTISFYKDSFNRNTTTIIKTTPGEVCKVDDITLTSTSSVVEGNVSLDSASTYESITILLKKSDNSSQYTTTTDPDGNYIFNKVGAGLYDLFISKDGYNSKEKNDITIEPSITKTLDSVKLEVAIRSVIGQVDLESSDDNAGALIIATNLSDTTLIYSAISNSDGFFTLAGMKPGEYRVAITSAGYRTTTLTTIDIVANSLTDIETTNLEIAKGSITGIVTLEGYTDYSEVTVELVGTSYTTTTDKNGIYNFLVPSGNYPGGVRFNKDKFEGGSDSETISVLTDSTYAIPSKELTCEQSLIKGFVDVAATEDNSTVKVSIVNLEEFSLTTTSDGYYEFDNVPLGSYTLRFNRENTPLVEKQIILNASSELVVDTIKIIPNSSSISGVVLLKDLTDNSGIKITAKSVDSDDEIYTTTSASGYFYMGNLISTGTYEVSFAKAGWQSVNKTISDLVALENRDITENSSVELIDITKPILNSVIINEGGNTTSNTTVTLSIDAFEQGSGIRKMKISWDGEFDSEAWIAYQPIFDFTMPNNSNGEKAVYIKIADLAENEADDTVSATINLTDQVKAVSGTLEDSELHWTKADSPILVAGNVIVPQNKTLIIDPGVDVQFNGQYALSIRGTLSAIGTDEEPIVFKSAIDLDYTGTWNGITAGSNTLQVDEDKYLFLLEEGSIIQHARIFNTSNGIRGKILIKDSYIETEGYALGSEDDYFTGYAVNNEMTGNINITDFAMIFGNNFTGNNGTFFAYWYGCKILNNLIYDFKNVNLNGLKQFDFNTVKKINSFSACTWGYQCSTIPTGNVISDVENTITLQNKDSSLRDMNFSNIFDNLGNPVISIGTKWSALSSHNWRYNYWGSANTLELESLKNNNKNNATFIQDGQDNSDLSIVDFSGFVSKPWEFAGYQGEGFIYFSPKYISYSSYSNTIKDVLIGDPIEFTLSMLTEGQVDKYRVSQDIQEVQNASWEDYSGSAYFNSIDESLLRDGWVDLFIQAMDSNGNVSALKTLSIGYDSPVITDISIKEGDVLSGDDTLGINYSFSDNGNLNYIKTYVDGIKVYESTYNNMSSEEYDYGSINLSEMLNGNHILEIVVTDSVGNSTSTGEINFVIDRTLPTLTDISLEEDTFIEEGESVDLSLSLIRTKHLKTVNILSNGNTSFTRAYTDDGKSSLDIETTIESVYLPNGDNELVVELIDYAGNISTSEPITFKVGGSAVAPVISGFDIEEGTVFNTNDDITLELTATDAGGIKSIDVTLGDIVIQTFSWPKYSTTLQTRTVSPKLMIPYRKNGNYLLKVVVSDFAGNTTTQSINVTIDRAIPTGTLSLNQTDDSLKISYSITNATYLKQYQILLDGNQLYYSIPNYKDSYSTRSGSKTWNIEDLPIGNHELSIATEDQAGNINIIEAQNINIEGESNNSEYGITKTWREDGTLIEDWSTLYLWNFDNPIKPNFETVKEERMGTVYQTRSGLGSSAGRISYSSNDELTFADSSWTFEYWAKMENTDSSSNIQMNLNKLIRSYLYKQSSTATSYTVSYYKHLSLIDNEISDGSVELYYSRLYRSNWHHYAVVSTGNEIRWYVDGLLEKQVTDTVSNKSSTGIYLYMGDSNNYVDEVRVSCEARSGDELWDYVQYVHDNNLLPED